MWTGTPRLLFPAILGAVVAIWATDPVLVAAQSSVTADDRVLGTWNLDVAKSRFNPGPAPKSQRRTYQAGPDGVRTAIRTTYADGHTDTVEYVAKYDSLEYPVYGSIEVDALRLTKVDADTAEATLTHAGKIIGNGRRVISSDGTTMTITYKGNGGMINYVEVFKKEQK